WAANGNGETGVVARIDTPLARRGDALVPTNWHDTIVALLDRLRAEIANETRTHVVASPFRANEDAGLALHLASLVGGGDAVYRSARVADEVPCPGFPRLARRRELAPNGRGLEALGYKRVGDDEGRGGLDAVAGSDGVVIVLGDELADQDTTFGSNARLYVYAGELLSPAAKHADFVLPLTTFAEQDGTFTNHEGRVQRFWAALQPPPHARPAWQILGVVIAAIEKVAAPGGAADAFRRVAELFPEFAGLSYEVIGSRGAPLRERLQVAAGAGTSAEEA
ncbi:MAG TPA: molybdopterin-dependent oxidoreductase, partial [Longimicrobiales bacterium]|nr:molybdopterin-dependent oxidoreductase [Longimicrobiales bacterium]